MKMRTLTPLIGLAMASGLTLAAPSDKPTKSGKASRGEPAKPEQTAPAPQAEAAKPASPQDAETRKMVQEMERLSLENKLQAERTAKATAKLRDEVARLKAERELMTEQLAIESVRRQQANKDEIAKLEAEKEKILRDSELLKARSEKLATELKSAQTEAMLKVTRLQSEMALIETTEKHGQFAKAKPIYLQNPLKDDGTLVISDRRIPLNGPISSKTADFITTRIDYWNNKDRKLPIFIVIDDCPGGSVMAGYQILKAMESSDAPVHVVVKSFAASMAACITTLAKESYAYPNAVILHHQISSQIMGARLNLTQQREFFEESTRWWQRLATPIATKMGLTTEELIKRMYEHSTSGDWSEFGEQAKDLKWVNHIISGVEESSFTKDPDAKASAPTAVPAPATPTRSAAMVEEVDEEGRPFMWLPRLNPKDVYFLYNPDGYYRVR
ncbi:MAG: ATP-dependent Clp protease proteolytic subunit [Verrucomicrobia bacterium]|nr:ATP-dependent Clp protease proteolytic subunit [Verrucomicrobiota bacterium]